MTKVMIAMIGLAAVAGCATQQAVEPEECDDRFPGIVHLEAKHVHLKRMLGIDGARRVGKSYIAEAFAKAEYDAYLLLDFSKVKKEVKDLFNNYLDDLDTFFMLLQNSMGVSLPREKSLVIFDEVQLFPKARHPCALSWRHTQIRRTAC